MGNIVLLDELTTCKIAAGEVIERPASVVKEMVENSIDAGATKVSVEIKSGGIRYIKISDNGSGIARDDTLICFDKHATSKIRSAKDLDTVSTLGFRGEALASIASVADVELTTRTDEDSEATFVHIEGGRILANGTRAAAKGTTFIVRNLFYNTPARYKFLKKDSTEASYILDILQKLALANPGVAMKLVSSGNETLRTPGNGDLKSTIFAIYGKKIADAIREIDYEENGIRISGFAGGGDASFGTRGHQFFFVNGRNIKSKTITSALDEACKTFIMKGKYAFAVLSVEINPYSVDVNVHPAKTEVRFQDESAVYRAVLHSIPYNDRSNDFEAVAYKPEYEKTGFAEIESRGAGQEESTTEDLPIPKVRRSLNTFKYTFDDNTEKIAEEISIPEITVNPFYKNAKVIGQVLETYIVLELGESMYLLDQHAAHERIMYEKIKRSITNGAELNSSPLLAPLTVELSAGEMENFRNLAGKIADFGFEAQEFGERDVIIRAVPSVLQGTNIENVFISLLEKGETATKDDFFDDEKLYSMACKSALKGNNKLDLIEIRALLDELAVTDQPGTCPHGRPIVTEFSRRDIEKKFKRIL